MNQLLNTNCFDVTETMIIIGTCLKNVQPKAYEELKKVSENIYEICLKETHMNMAVAKIIGMLSREKVKKIIFVTVDKSPHCVQLHYIFKELENMMDISKFDIKNYVAVDNELVEITPNIISLSKNLSKLKSEINTRNVEELTNKEGMSDFLKFAHEHGKIRDVKEAFKEYPVEEEWHKGKIKNIVSEDCSNYGTYEIGDIVFVEKFNYSNGEKGSRHFFVIIDQNNIAVPIENFGMLLSSKIDKIKYKENRLIEKNKENGLNKDSIVKTDIIYKILNNQILFKIGNVDSREIEEYKKKYYLSNNETNIY